MEQKYKCFLQFQENTTYYKYLENLDIKGKRRNSMKKTLVITVLLAATMLSACSSKEEADTETVVETTAIADERLNTQNGELSYTYEPSSESELKTAEDVTYKDSFHVEFENSDDSDLYVGTYEYNGHEYTAGYADNCDFKEYLVLPEIESAEAAVIDDKDYNFAYYKDDFKAAYYYVNDDKEVYAYTQDPMTNDDFKQEVADMNLRLEDSEN